MQVPSNVDRALLRALAEFRHRLRQFLQASEQAAHGAGLHPQQHQLLLQVAACELQGGATIAYVAERLGVRHNSAVELTNRCVDEGLVVRQVDPEDGRRVVLEITTRGEVLLQQLAAFHAQELGERGQGLIAALTRIQQSRGAEVGERLRVDRAEEDS